MKSKEKYPCPVCGNKYLDEKYGSFEICQICGWEEDGYQQRHPDEIGANGKWTLNEARKAWSDGKTIKEYAPNPNSK